MIIKRQVSFKLRPTGNPKTGYHILMHVSFNGNRIRLATGCQVNSQDAWDEEKQLVYPGYKGPKGETDTAINNTLRKDQDVMDTAFKFFEVNEIYPSPSQVTEKYIEKLKGAKPKQSEVKKEPKKVPGFWEVFDSFVFECGEKNSWTKATHEKMAALKEDLSFFKNDISFSDLNESGLTSFVHFLRDEKVLKTPRKKKEDRKKQYDKDDTVGLKNSTIKKKLEFLTWFLNWATDHGYNTNIAYRTYKPTLKETQKKVIYLTQQELRQLQNFRIPSGLSHLDGIRDVFLFCCFSGLRHSDVYNLRRNDIKDDHIEITTVKTADSVSIELNSVTRSILEKYKNYDFAGNKALPVIQNQPMNRELKTLCCMAGINEPIRVTSYKGNKRKDEIKKKWELIGTHTGRRTFIVNCLSLGIAPNVVMKWTGHSDYKSMKPYIDIVDSIKASEMTKLDNFI